MRTEQMKVKHMTAVSGAIDKGLPPVPCGVHPDGPPERACTTKRHGEDEPKQAGGDQADEALAMIVAVAGPEQVGGESSRDPEADGSAVGGTPCVAKRAGYAANDGEKEKASRDELLEESDAKEADSPFDGKTTRAVVGPDGALSHTSVSTKRRLVMPLL